MDVISFLTNTMVAERACGVATYTLLLVIACNAIKIGNAKRVRLVLILYSLVLSILGFFYIPGEDADLVRLLGYMHEWSELNLKEIVTLCKESSSPAYVAYFWLIGQAGVDGLLPAITTFIGTICLFSCLWDYANRNECSMGSIALGLAFLMGLGFLMGYVSNVRNTLAFSIILWRFYSECYKKGSILLSVPFYIFAALMHPAALLIVIARFTYLLFQPGKEWFKRIIYFLFITTFAVLLYTYGRAYLSEMTTTGLGYLFQGGYFYVWEFLVHLIYMIFLIYMLVTTKHIKFTIEGNRIFRQFIAPTSFIVLLSAFFSYAIFTRMSMLLTFMAPLILIELLDNQAFKQEHPHFQAILLATIVLTLTTACLRGNLSGFKFFLIK